MDKWYSIDDIGIYINPKDKRLYCCVLDKSQTNLYVITKNEVFKKNDLKYYGKMMRENIKIKRENHTVIVRPKTEFTVEEIKSYEDYINKIIKRNYEEVPTNQK